MRHSSSLSLDLPAGEGRGRAAEPVDLCTAVRCAGWKDRVRPSCCDFLFSENRVDL